MKNVKMNKLKPVGKKRTGLWVFLALVLLVTGACIWYVNDYYHAEAYVDAYLQSSDNVTVTIEDNIVFLDGTGTASITREEQQKQTVEAIIKMIGIL